MKCFSFVKVSITTISSLILLLFFVSAVAGAKKSGFPIDAGGSCVTDSCHAESGTKKYVHEPAADASGCSDCHGMEREGVHTFNLLAEGGELCAECHEGKAEKEFVHTIVSDGECTGCHDPHQSDNPKQLILPPTAELCYECHDDKGDKEYVHSALSEGDCTDCHDPHQSDNPKQLILPPTSELCHNCHDEGDFVGTYTHEPAREGDCLTCHNPHSADQPNQLVDAVPTLCVDCHGIEMIDQEDTVLTSPNRLFESEEVHLHSPFEQGKCLECHLPHVSGIHKLLRKNYPVMIYSEYSEDAYGLCMECHREMEEVLKEPRTLTGTKFRNGNLNLHQRHVNKKKGRTCKACHHHHGTKNERLIRTTFHFGTMELTLSYEKTESGGSCTSSCHLPVNYDRYDPAEVPFKTTPREGENATPAELEMSRKRDSGKGE